jgi:ribosomal protein S14
MGELLPNKKNRERHNEREFEFICESCGNPALILFQYGFCRPCLERRFSDIKRSFNTHGVKY